jgi:hypothetical protein
MASCCGSGNTCTCAVTGGNQIEVTGTGSLSSPYVIDYTGGGGGDGSYFLPEDYVPPEIEIGDVEDWQPYINDAIDGAATCGGTVFFSPGKTYPWSGDINVKSGVWLLGSNSNGGCDTLLALDATSRVRFGLWAGHDRPGGMTRMRINGNNTGHAKGLVACQGVHGQLDYLFIYNAAGYDIDFDGAQNMSARALFCSTAGVSAMGIRNGAGGLNFFGCHLTSSYHCLRIYDDDSYSNNVYPFGSAHINFYGGIMEIHEGTPAAKMVMDVRSSNNLHFWNTGFSLNGAMTSEQGCVIKISNPEFPIVSSVGFHSCNFNGSTNFYDIFHIDGGNYVSFDGDTYYQNTTNFVEVIEGLPIVRLGGNYITGNNSGQILGASGSGGFVNCYLPVKEFLDFRMPDTRPNILSTRREADGNAGLRMFITRDGTIAYSDGTDSGIHAAINYIASTEMIGISSLATSGRFGAVMTSLSVTTAGQDVEIDSKVTSCHQLLITPGSSIGSMTILNAVGGTRLEIWISQPAGGGAAYAWPTNARFAGGAAPSNTDSNTTTVVTFRYHQGSAKWIEVERSVGVPHT